LENEGDFVTKLLTGSLAVAPTVVAAEAQQPYVHPQKARPVQPRLEEGGA
jgi:hypothetical protein